MALQHFEWFVLERTGSPGEGDATKRVVGTVFGPRLHFLNPIYFVISSDISSATASGIIPLLPLLCPMTHLSILAGRGGKPEHEEQVTSADDLVLHGTCGRTVMKSEVDPALMEDKNSFRRGWRLFPWSVRTSGDGHRKRIFEPMTTAAYFFCASSQLGPPSLRTQIEMRSSLIVGTDGMVQSGNIL